MKAPSRIQLEHVPCDLCGADDCVTRYAKPDTWLRDDAFDYPVVECRRCGLVYVNPRPIFACMGALYPPGYHDGRNDDIHNRRYQAQYEYIAPFRGNRVLDIGCAKGDWLHFLHGKWPESEMHGLDAFSSGVNHPHIVFHAGQLPAADIPPSHFDLVTAWAVFEHLHQPSAYFSAASTVLRPGGRLVILVTNSDSLYGSHAYKEDIPRHLYHFNRRSLARYASQNGFKVERIAFDERFWDGTGSGTMTHLVRRIFNISWKDFLDHRHTLPEKVMLRAARLFDRILFALPWESMIGRSGIMIAVLRKPE